MASLVEKRRRLARQFVVRATVTMDAINALLILAAEKEALTEGFQESDFATDGLTNLTAERIDGVITAARALELWMDDGATSAYARNRLLEARA